MQEVQTTTYKADIYIAGDLTDVKRICRAHVFEVGLCVTVEPVDFIYTGGAESGVRVGLINYPRFPAEPDVIFYAAHTLARKLLEGLSQHSLSIVATDKTLWLSRREAK